MELKETEVRSIPESNMFILKEKIEKINKKAVKLGCNTLEIVVVSEHFVEKKDETTGESLGMIKTLDVKVVGDSPVINGWHLVAELQHVSDEANAVLIKKVPGEEVPLQYRDANRYNCDHCHKGIYRRETFVVKNDLNDYKQVGRSCIRDFLGHPNPEYFLAYAEFWHTIAATFDECEGSYYGHRESRYIPLDQFLVYVDACIEKFGWMSKKKSNELYDSGKTDYYIPTTSSRAFDNFYYGLRGFKLDSRDKVEITTKNREKIVKVIDWATNKFVNADVDTLSDFDFNLRVITSSEMIDHKMVNLAACLVPAYNREVEHYEKIAKEAKISNHVGTIGKREIFELKLNKVTSFETAYGISHLHIFEDMSGNKVNWFASSNNLDEGKFYKVKGTVKDHSEFKGCKQTIITHCKVED